MLQLNEHYYSYQEGMWPHLLVNLPSSFKKAFSKQVVALPLLPNTTHPILNYRMLYDILLISDILQYIILLYLVVLFNDTWSQQCHSVSCMIIPFYKLATQQIRPQATHIWQSAWWFAYDQINLPPSFLKILWSESIRLDVFISQWPSTVNLQANQILWPANLWRWPVDNPSVFPLESARPHWHKMCCLVIITIFYPVRPLVTSAGWSSINFDDAIHSTTKKSWPC